MRLSTSGSLFSGVVDFGDKFMKKKLKSRKKKLKSKISCQTPFKLFSISLGKSSFYCNFLALPSFCLISSRLILPTLFLPF
jgi:hypothetical protein